MKYLLVNWLLPIVTVVFGGWLSSDLQTSYDTRVFLSETNENFQALKEFEAEFGRRSTVYIIARMEGKIVTEEPFRSIIGRIEDASWHLPYASKVTGLASYPHSIIEADTFRIENLLEFAASEGDVSSLGNLQIQNLLVSEDLSVSGTIVSFDLPIGEEGIVKNLYLELIALVNAFREEYPLLELKLTGEVPLMYAFGDAAESDSTSLIPMAILIVVAVAWFCLRHYVYVFLLTVVVAMSVAISMGLYAAAGLSINSGTSILPIVLIVVLMANGVHFLWGVKNEFRFGVQFPEAVTAAKEKYVLPVFLSGATTSLGFLLLSNADAPPFRHLGIYSSIGVMAGTLLLILWLPDALVNLKKHPTSKAGVAKGSAERLGSSIYLWGRDKKVLYVLIAMAVLATMGLSKLYINDDFVGYFDHDYEVRQGAEFAAQHLGGPNYLEFWIDSGQVEGAYSPEYHIVVSRFVSQLRSKAIVSNVHSLTSEIEDLSMKFRGMNLNQITPDEIRQYLLTYEFGLPLGHELGEFIDVQGRSTRITALLRLGSSREIISLEEEAYAWFRENASQYDLVVTGINVPTAYMSYRNTYDVLISLIIVVCVISLILGFLYGRYSICFIALFSISVPMILGFGTWGWIVGEIGLASSAVLAITMGVVIDDAIHIIHRYVKLQKEFQSSEQLVIDVMTQITPPIVTSSLMLVIGFSVLAASSFGVNQVLGICIGMIVSFALIVDLLFVPHLLEIGT